MCPTVKFVYLCNRIMKSLRYILPLMLSLLIIYTGVGVSICSCMLCERACFICATPCDSCHDSDQEALPAECEDGDCSVSLFKVNLMQQEAYASVVVPTFDLFCGLLPAFQTTVFRSGVVEVPYVVPPNPSSSRHYLALYSLLLI